MPDLANHPTPAQSPDDLGRVLAVARACMTQEMPGLQLLSHESVAAAGNGRWEVTIRGENTEPHTVVVDADRQSCGETLVQPVSSPTLGSLAELMDQAWVCGQTLGGVGVGDTPLVREGMRLHSQHGLDRHFSISEREVRSLPTGLDLVAGQACGRLVMD